MHQTPSPGHYEFCRLYIDRASAEEVSALLVTLLGGAFVRRDLAAPPFDVTVEQNPDRAEVPTDDFITWPVTVEVEVAPDTRPAVVVDTLTRILQALRSRGARVVAACDYEDELPRASRPEEDH